MRKTILFSAMAMALALTLTCEAQVVQDFTGTWMKGSGLVESNSLSRIPSKVTAQELLGCDEGTVFGGEYDGGDDTWSGTASSDEGRKDAATSIYQHFSDCYYKFDGVRFLGVFNYYSAETGWHYCSDRGGINENGEMTKPIRVRLAFYEDGDDGRPGKEVYSKIFDVIGEKTGVKRGDDTQGYSHVYAFRIDLGEELKMDHGFMQISAVDTKDETVDCYLSLFTASSSPGYSLMKIDKRDGNEPTWSTYSSCCFCFYGSGEFIAQKALSFDRILSPSTTANSKYEKVQVEISNIGSQDINDATLELWQDNKIVATEKVNANIQSLENYKYTFKARVDCSDVGTHHITVKNVTPNSEVLSSDTISVNVVTNDGMPVYSESKSTSGYFHITNVKIGDIDNSSEASDYSDYTDMKTSIQPGEQLTLEVTTSKKSAEIGAWVDWNGNGSFDDDGEAMLFSGKTATVEIPKNLSVTAGDKRLRIVISYDTPQPVGIYSFGETEDYTITVKNESGAPVVKLSNKDIVVKTACDKRSTSVELTNDGEGILNGDVKYDYILPNAPTSNYTICKSSSIPSKMKCRLVSSNIMKAEENPDIAAETEYVLKYDNGKYNVIGITNSAEAVYANYFPGEMLYSLSGMEINSIDVFVATPSKENSIVIYSEGTQNMNGKVIIEQKFMPQTNSWNRIVLDKPVKIGNSDIWIGYKASGMKNGQFCIGYDRGGAVVGFGDRVNIDGDMWWSMSDLGMDYNYCIRANVTGKRTPAINWLSVANKHVEANAGENVKLGIDIDASKLDAGLYEAKIELSTNDQLCSTIEIPVYVVNGMPTEIISKKYTGCSTIKFARNTLSVVSEKEISGVTVYDIAGHTINSASINGKECNVALENIPGPLCILTVKYVDGTESSVKIPVIK